MCNIFFYLKINGNKCKKFHKCKSFGLGLAMIIINNYLKKFNLPNLLAYKFYFFIWFCFLSTRS